VTKRKKRVLTIQILLFLTAFILIYFTYYYNKTSIKVDRSSQKVSVSKEDSQNKNIFEDVEYKGIDLNGNRYLIKSKLAEFNEKNPELIDMKVMTAFFYFKDGTVLKITGDYGKYNNKNNDMLFRDNIEAIYEGNYLYADNLDYFSTKYLLTIYGNIKGESIEGNITSDRLNFNLSKKTLDVSMFSDKQINLDIKE
jgi:hypothetical protein